MKTLALPTTRLLAMGTSCPDCQAPFEDCICGMRPDLPRHQSDLALMAGGGWGGMEDDDNRRGYERDETDQFHRLVRQLVDEGDSLAAAAGRRARRTLAEMVPGTTQQPVLHLTRSLTFTPTAPAEPVAGGPCTRCSGAGGKVVDTSEGGVTRQTWHSCSPCGGTGVAR
ncbi:hypothetical protein ACFV1U_39350 [Streptomyces microflavus]|uniref:hypothetical protein n=1 Tax=Streptomyces microflavus TaxID=1919 RepID=UPI0036BA3E0F